MVFVTIVKGNPRCKQIPWQRDHEKIAAWKEARTGYPFIDAIMTQLRQEGLHNLSLLSDLTIPILCLALSRMDPSSSSACRGMLFNSRRSLAALGRGLHCVLAQS